MARLLESRLSGRACSKRESCEAVYSFPQIIWPNGRHIPLARIVCLVRTGSCQSLKRCALLCRLSWRRLKRRVGRMLLLLCAPPFGASATRIAAMPMLQGSRRGVAREWCRSLSGWSWTLQSDESNTVLHGGDVLSKSRVIERCPPPYGKIWRYFLECVYYYGLE